MTLSVKIMTGLSLFGHSLIIPLKLSSGTATVSENFAPIVRLSTLSTRMESMDRCTVIQSCSNRLQWSLLATQVQLQTILISEEGRTDQ